MIYFIRPYSDIKNFDINKNMTQIKIYHQEYNRDQLMMGFNPTFSDIGTIINYNFIEKVKNGVADSN